MNDKLSVQVFDSLLEEWLTDQHPPDLSARIEAAWMQEKAGGSPLPHPNAVDGASPEPNSATLGPGNLVPAELVECVDDSAAAEDTVDRDVVHQDRGRVEVKKSREDSNSRPSQQALTTRSSSPRRSTQMALWMTVAAGLLALLGWQAWQGVDGAPERLAEQPSPKADSAGPALVAGDTVTPDGNRQIAADPSSVAEAPSGAEVLDLRDLPFPNGDQAPSLSVEQPLVASSVAAEKLSDADLVAQLDVHLRDIWDQVGLEPSSPLSDVELAQKMHQTMVGRGLPDGWEQKFADGDEALDRLRWAQTVAGLRDFPQHWSQRIVRQWLRKSTLPLDGEPARVLTQSVAESIATSQPWDQIPSQVLGGDLDPSATATSSPSTVFVSALSGGGNHRLVKRLGVNFLNTNLSCSRCHDQKVAGSPELGQQPIYWSLVALLKGIEARGSGQREPREIRDNQLSLFAGTKRQSVFYDLPDGQLKAAEARFPDGVSWQASGQSTPRRALAEWISKSPALDRAVVNQTWKILLGRNLAPQVSGIDLAANAARQELLGFLATQFRAHDRDVKQLVTWIASSEAFARSTSLLGREQWLEIDDDELEQLRLSELVFASGNSLGSSAEARQLTDSLAAVLKWSNSRPELSQQDAIFAQPGPQTKKQRPIPAARPSGVLTPASSFIVHGERPTTAELSFVRRLLKSSRLSWEQRVEHIVALSDAEVASDRVQRLAKELLRHHDGDPERALLDLLWSVENADAG